MIGWLKKRTYRNKTLGTVQAMTLMIGDAGKLLEKHSGIHEAIVKNFNDGVSEGVAATHITAALLGDSIQREDDPERKQFITQLLEEWAVTDNPRSMRKELREGTLNQDLLLTRLQWAILMGQDMLGEGEIEGHDFAMLKDEIYGSLKGEPPGQRALDRISLALDNILGKSA